MYLLGMIRFGYPAKNLTLPASTNRTLRLAGVGDAEKIRGLIWENLASVETIVRWNAERGIRLFRIGQALIPFASHPAFPYDWVISSTCACAALARPWGLYPPSRTDSTRPDAYSFATAITARVIFRNPWSVT